MLFLLPSFLSQHIHTHIHRQPGDGEWVKRRRKNRSQRQNERLFFLVSQLATYSRSAPQHEMRTHGNVKFGEYHEYEKITYTHTTLGSRGDEQSHFIIFAEILHQHWRQSSVGSSHSSFSFDFRSTSHLSSRAPSSSCTPTSSRGVSGWFRSPSQMDERVEFAFDSGLMMRKKGHAILLCMLNKLFCHPFLAVVRSFCLGLLFVVRISICSSYERFIVDFPPHSRKHTYTKHRAPFSVYFWVRAAVQFCRNIDDGCWIWEKIWV